MTGRDTLSVALFAYGSLRQPEVQLANYGRVLEGAPDALAGYRLGSVEIDDPDVVRLSGKGVHTIARFTGDPADVVPGLVLRLTGPELDATDRYETDAYRRTEVELASGLAAFAYVGPDW